MAKKSINKIVDRGVNLLLISFAMVALWIFFQVFFFASFRIPSDSMEPELTIGDNVLVNKLTTGPRLFNIFASMRNEQTEIYRIPGFKKIKRNDILVFNFPHPNNWNKIEMHILKYYIKRCIGLPGDTLSIRNGSFHVEGVQIPLGNIESQKEIAVTEKFQDEIFHSFPYDSIIGWNIKDFGPLYIPKKRDSITLDQTNYRLYKKLIEWEQQGELQYKESTVFLKGNPIIRIRISSDGIVF